MKAATDLVFGAAERCTISIHAAREGGDSASTPKGVMATVFQSTPPVKAATCSLRFSLNFSPFQSTPPVKAATGVNFPRTCASVFKSTPPVKAATNSSLRNRETCAISIHAAREGGDFRVREYYAFPDEISIHAAREGGDPITRTASSYGTNFNPRRP